MVFKQGGFPETTSAIFQHLLAGVFWFYAVLCLLALLFGWKLLPETKGRSLEAIAEEWRRHRP